MPFFLVPDTRAFVLESMSYTSELLPIVVLFEVGIEVAAQCIVRAGIPDLLRRSIQFVCQPTLVTHDDEHKS